MLKRVLPIFLIIIAGVIVYFNSISAPFIWDDIWLIAENSRIKDLSNFTDLSGTRYLTFLSFTINYKIHGLNVAGYHIFNIAVHIINALLVYWLVLLIFRMQSPQRPARGGKTEYRIQNEAYNNIKGNENNPSPIPLPRGEGVEGRVERVFSGERTIALFAGLLFVSHLVHTMAVTYITQRSVLLATVFYLLSLISFIKARMGYQQSAISSQPSAKNKRNHILYYSISFVSAALAMKCKEISFTLPIMIVLFDRFLFGRKWSFKKTIIYTIPILLTLLIIPLSKPQAEVFSRPRMDFFRIEGQSVLSGLDAAKLSTIPRKDYMLTQVRAVFTYMRLFLLPINLNFDYDYPVYSSFLNSNVFLSFIFIVLIVGVSIYFLCTSRVRSRELRLILFGIIWFFAALSIESWVVVLNYVIFEYRLYLPSAALILSVAGLMRLVISKFENKSRYILAFIGVIFLFLVATHVRNNVIRDEIALWEDSVKKSPFKATTHVKLGNIYLQHNKLTEAVQELKIALTLDPYSIDAYTNIGMVYYKQKQIDKAILEFKNALVLNYGNPLAHYYLALTYYDQGLIDIAVEEFKAALMFNPDDAVIHNKLGYIYYSQKRFADAAQEFMTALRLNPIFPDSHHGFGLLYHSQGRLKEAAMEYRLALKLNPSSKETHNNLGNVYMDLGLIDDAIIHYREAIRLDPNFEGARNNLRLAHQQKGL